MTANIAVALAQGGSRVGVVDTDIKSPGIHVLFGMDENNLKHTLNDYLWARCSIGDAAHDVTPQGISGEVFLIPSSIKAGEITRVLREGYDPGLLNDGFQDLIETMELEYLLIDTHPGLHEETILSIAISDILVLLMRPDQQDFQGTGVTVEVARKLGVPSMYMVVNKIPKSVELEDLKANIEEAYDIEVASMIPHSDKMMVLGSADIFTLRYPDDPLADKYRQLAAHLALQV